ncbi:MAG: glycosyltransferase family 2 protein [Gemmatimonadales bacterium]
MISIIVCTRNRQGSLARLLEDLREARFADDAELLVVDNGSAGGPGPMLTGLTRVGDLPARVLEEPRLGQSFARNRGIDAARGGWLLFLDDDVRLAPDWAPRLTGELERLGAVAGGGRVDPVWPAGLPRWVSTDPDRVERIAFVQFSLGDRSRLLNPDDAPPIGCNMGFRREVFASLGGFATALGHAGNRLIGGEDAEVFARLRAAGMPAGYVADAVVRHPVDPERLTLGYLIRRRYWEGIGASGQPRVAGRALAGVPGAVWRAFGRHAASATGAALRGDWPAAAHHLGGAAHRVGFAVGSWRGPPS